MKLDPKNSLVVIDFDRTIFDTDKAMELVGRVCAELSLDFKLLKKEQEEIESRGKSYQPLSFIESFDETLLPRFEKKFCELADDKTLVYEGVTDFFKELDNIGIPNLILTYGEPRWQLLKLKASKLDTIPYIITSFQEKGKVLAGWQNNDGKIVVPLQGFSPAAAVALVDDKIMAFNGLPNNCSGFLIRRDKKAELTDKIPDYIHEIDGLDQILE